MFYQLFKLYITVYQIQNTYFLIFLSFATKYLKVSKVPKVLVTCNVKMYVGVSTIDLCFRPKLCLNQLNCGFETKKQKNKKKNKMRIQFVFFFCFFCVLFDGKSDSLRGGKRFAINFINRLRVGEKNTHFM